MQTHHAASVMAILETFGLADLAGEFKKLGGVHQPWNMLTLEHNLHNKFDNLELWFKHTDQVCHSETCKSY